MALQQDIAVLPPPLASWSKAAEAGLEPSGLFLLNGILNQGLSNAWACAPFFIGLERGAVYLAVMICDSQTAVWLAALLGRERASPLSVLGQKAPFFVAVCQMPR